MRSRTIRPGFFDDFALGRLPHGARLLFIGLWCVADREGRILDIPRRIAAEIFPHDTEGIEADVANWIAMLDCAGVITRYESDGQKCLHIKNFARFQKVHPHEVESRIPPPPQPPRPGSTNVTAKVYQCHGEGIPMSRQGSTNVTAKVNQCQRTSTSTSTSINPPTPLAGGNTRPARSKGFEASPSNGVRTPADSEDRINALANSYPTTAGKQQGIRAICEIVSESADQEAALAGIERHWSAWCALLAERDAQYRPRLDRFVRSHDWMHPPPEQTRKGKAAEQPAKPDIRWDASQLVDAQQLGLTAEEFAAKLAKDLGDLQ